MALKETKGNYVQHSTFLKWQVTEHIIPEIKSINGRNEVVRVHCALCARHTVAIRRDLRLKGQALKELDRYICGTNYVTKHSVQRHLDSVAHKIGLDVDKITTNPDAGPVQSENNNSDSSTIKSASTSHSFFPATQPRIDKTLRNLGHAAHEKLLKTAYLMAVEGVPLKNFSTLVQVQKANGVKLISGVQDGRACREYISCIADAIREKLAIIISSSTSFSLLTDGSQARKTNVEKELVLIRIIRGGLPVYYCLALQDCDQFGGADANSLKSCVDDVFLNKLKIEKDKYIDLMVSATSDGASVNTGIYNGLLTQLRNDGRNWLISVHCVSHRAELALSDSIKKDKAFSELDDLMMLLFYTFKRSGKLKRRLTRIAKAQDTYSYCFPKVHGTRFVAHKRRGLESLIHNWGLMILFIENGLASRDDSFKKLEAKMIGILRKLKNFKLLAIACFYKIVLDNLSEFSLNLEKGEISVLKVPLYLEFVISSNNELIQENYQYFLNKCNVELEQNETGLTVKWKLLKQGHAKKSVLNREYSYVTYSQFERVGQTAAETQIESIKSTVLPVLEKSLKNRFISFESEIFKAMHWLDPANWDDTQVEISSMQKLAEHFCVPLKRSKFDFDISRLEKEWPKVKKTTKFFHSSLKAAALWEKMLVYKRQEFPNVCLLAEVVLTIAPSNSYVEKCFSQLTAMLSDRRLCMRADTMENLLLIKCNHLCWSPEERDDLISCALENFLSKRRVLSLDETTRFNSIGVNFHKRAKSKQSEITNIIDNEADMSDHNDTGDEDDNSLSSGDQLMSENLSDSDISIDSDVENFNVLSDQV